MYIPHDIPSYNRQQNYDSQNRKSFSNNNPQSFQYSPQMNNGFNTNNLNMPKNNTNNISFPSPNPFPSPSYHNRQPRR